MNIRRATIGFGCALLVYLLGNLFIRIGVQWANNWVKQSYKDDALIVAVEGGTLSNVEQCLKDGANPNTYTHTPPIESVLQRAKRLKEDKIIDILIKMGATP